jgi:hypothetical protein
VEWNIAVRVRVRKGHVPRDVGGRGWVGEIAIHGSVPRGRRGWSTPAWALLGYGCFPREQNLSAVQDWGR